MAAIVAVQDGGHVGRREPLGQAGEALDVGEHQGGLGQRVGGAARAFLVVEDGGGDALAHIFAERVAQVLPLGEAVDHLVEAARRAARPRRRRSPAGARRGRRSATRRMPRSSRASGRVSARDDPVVDGGRADDRGDQVDRGLAQQAVAARSSRCRRPAGSWRRRRRTARRSPTLRRKRAAKGADIDAAGAEQEGAGGRRDRR